MWRKASDSEGHVYYYNRLSREVRWDRPPDLEDVGMKKKPSTAAKPNAAPKVLYGDWRSAVDASGLTYYYHRRTKETSWEPPIMGDDIQLSTALPPVSHHVSSVYDSDSSIQTETAPISVIETVRGANSGRGEHTEEPATISLQDYAQRRITKDNAWRKAVDAHGRVYYYHRKTKSVQWEPPEGWSDPVSPTTGKDMHPLDSGSTFSKAVMSKTPLAGSSSLLASSLEATATTTPAHSVLNIKEAHGHQNLSATALGGSNSSALRDRPSSHFHTLNTPKREPPTLLLPSSGGSLLSPSNGRSQLTPSDGGGVTSSSSASAALDRARAILRILQGSGALSASKETSSADPLKTSTPPFQTGPTSYSGEAKSSGAPTPLSMPGAHSSNAIERRDATAPASNLDGGAFALLPSALLSSRPQIAIEGGIAPLPRGGLVIETATPKEQRETAKRLSASLLSQRSFVELLDASANLPVYTVDGLLSSSSSSSSVPSTKTQEGGILPAPPSSSTQTWGNGEGSTGSLPLPRLHSVRSEGLGGTYSLRDLSHVYAATDATAVVDAVEGADRHEGVSSDARGENDRSGDERQLQSSSSSVPSHHSPASTLPLPAAFIKRPIFSLLMRSHFRDLFESHPLIEPPASPEASAQSDSESAVKKYATTIQLLNGAEESRPRYSNEGNMEGILPIAYPGAALSPRSLKLQMAGYLTKKSHSTFGVEGWGSLQKRYFITHRWLLLYYKSELDDADSLRAAIDLRFLTDLRIGVEVDAHAIRNRRDRKLRLPFLQRTPEELFLFTGPMEDLHLGEGAEDAPQSASSSTANSCVLELDIGNQVERYTLQAASREEALKWYKGLLAIAYLYGCQPAPGSTLEKRLGDVTLLRALSGVVSALHQQETAADVEDEEGEVDGATDDEEDTAANLQREGDEAGSVDEVDEEEAEKMRQDQAEELQADSRAAGDDVTQQQASEVDSPEASSSSSDTIQQSTDAPSKSPASPTDMDEYASRTQREESGDTGLVMEGSSRTHGDFPAGIVDSRQSNKSSWIFRFLRGTSLSKAPSRNIGSSTTAEVSASLRDLNVMRDAQNPSAAPSLTAIPRRIKRLPHLLQHRREIAPSLFGSSQTVDSSHLATGSQEAQAASDSKLHTSPVGMPHSVSSVSQQIASSPVLLERRSPIRDAFPEDSFAPKAAPAEISSSGSTSTVTNQQTAAASTIPSPTTISARLEASMAPLLERLRKRSGATGTTIS